MYKLPHEDIIFIKNVLRQASVKWRGRSECLKRARKRVLVRKSLKGLPVYKFHWQCARCRKWFTKQNEMEVDHIVEVGTFINWDDYIYKVFCGQDNLQCLCGSCHQKKTLQFNSARSLYKRKPRP